MPDFSLSALRGLLPQMSGANFGTASPQEDADMPLTGLDKAMKYAFPMSAQPSQPASFDETVVYKTPHGNITQGDIDRGMDVGMATSGGGLATKPIRAFHSSPHDFDAFDLSKIGTGEGAQVYGHGLYFAENPAVSGQGGQYWNQFTKRFEGPEYLAADKLKKSGFDRDVATASSQWEVRELEDQLKRGVQPPGLQGGPFDEHTLRSITKNMLYDKQSELDLLRSDKPVGPRTYEVNINADPAHFLDWDKPLAQMSPEVQQKLQDAWLAHPQGHSKQTGGQIYESSRLVRGDYRDPVAATQKLMEAGIPGIKYLDQGSRGPSQQIATLQTQLAKPGWLPETRAELQSKLDELLKQPPPSSNYVVFDPKIIDIMKKYGLAGLAPLGAAGIGAGQPQQPQQGL